MEGKLVTFYTSDNLELHGYLVGNPEDSSGVVLHVHGLGGNFYKSSFISSMTKNYLDIGLSFLTFNNRGHDFVTRIKNKDRESIWSGYSFENFSKTHLDLLAAYNFVKENGWRTIYFQGHSSGTQKIIYTINKEKIDLGGIILISPCDDWGLITKKLGDRVLTTLRSKYKKMPLNKIIQEKFMYEKPLTKTSFLSHFDVDSSFNIFHYSQPQKSFLELNRITFPTLVIFGENDYVENLESAKKILVDNIQTEISFKIIPGADHNYYLKEEILTKEITFWIKNLPNRNQASKAESNWRSD